MSTRTVVWGPFSHDEVVMKAVGALGSVEQMFARLLLILMAATWCACAKPGSRRREAPAEPATRPVLALWIQGPMLNLCHTLSANVVVYPSGRVIYQRAESPWAPARYWQASLSADEFGRLLERERLVALANLERAYNVAAGTESTNYILRWRTEEEGEQQVLVTGLLEPEPVGSAKERRRTPAPFLSMFDALSTLTPLNPMPYEPGTIEVRLARTHRYEEGATPWPRDWPSPVVEQSEGDSPHPTWVSSLPGSGLDAVMQEVCAHQVVAKAVELDGVTYFFLGVHAALPGMTRQRPASTTP